MVRCGLNESLLSTYSPSLFCSNSKNTDYIRCQSMFFDTGSAHGIVKYFCYITCYIHWFRKFIQIMSPTMTNILAICTSFSRQVSLTKFANKTSWWKLPSPSTDKSKFVLSIIFTISSLHSCKMSLALIKTHSAYWPFLNGCRNDLPTKYVRFINICGNSLFDCIFIF